MSEEITVEVVYALPHDETLLKLTLVTAATVEQAITASGVLEKFPEIDLARNKVGIYGKLVKLDVILHDKDRIEIYRPLTADPKEARRQRAARTKALNKPVPSP